jgi:hypothetical protein
VGSSPTARTRDSPLLAYFKPEGDDDLQRQGADLEERFYEYLVQHHGSESQVIIIENQQPPSTVEADLKITVFTRNPAEGRLVSCEPFQPAANSSFMLWSRRFGK